MKIKIPDGFKKCVCNNGLIKNHKCCICKGKGYYSKKYKELKILMVQDEKNTMGNIQGVANMDGLITVMKLCVQEMNKL